MRFFSRAVDRFCVRHPGFGIPRLMLGIVILSAAAFLLLNPEMLGFLLFRPDLIVQGQIWRLVTWVFIAPGAGGGMSGMFFTAIALYFYYFIGSTLEREWGTGRFTIYYLFGMLMHIIYGFAVYFLFESQVILQPVYLNLSMFFAFAVLFPDHIVRLFFIIPIKIKWLALLNAVFFVFSLVTNLIAGFFVAAVLPVMALLNFILMCGGDLLEYLRPLMHRASPQVLNFKKEAKRARRDLKDKPYRHKCAVCGKTDTEDSDAEFRYCSLCSGYHCFCSEHINNHIHFK